MNKCELRCRSWLPWFMCSLGALFYSFEYLLRISPSVMEEALANHYRLTSVGFGMLSSVYYYTYVPMQIPVGLLVDRFGPKRLITLACFVCTIGTYLFSISGYLWVALVGRALVGFGSAFAFVGVLKLATVWLPEDKLAFVAGLTAALGTVGAMLGDNALGYLVTQYGWLFTNQLAAFFGLGLTVLLWLLLQDATKQSDTDRPIAPSRTVAMVRELQRSITELKEITLNHQIWLAGLYGCFVYLPTTVLAELWGIPYFTHAYHLSNAEANFANSMIFLGFTFGAPMMGMISDHIRLRKLPMAVGAIGSLIIVSVVLSCHLSLNYLCWWLFFLGMLYGSQTLAFVVACEQVTTQAAGTAIAFTNMVVMLGGMFLQPLVGFLLDWHLHQRMPGKILGLDAYTDVDFRFALMLLPIGIAIALVCTLFIKETYARSVTSP